MGATWDPRWSSPQARRDADAFYAELSGAAPGLDADAAEAAPVTLPAGFRMGVWVDVGGKSLGDHGTEHASRLYALGITDACIMINGNKHNTFGFKSVSQARIRDFVALLRDSGIEVTLTSWVRPKRTFIDALLRELPPFAQEIGARAIEFDAEGPWTGHGPSGFASHDEAAAYLFAGLRSVRAAGMEIAVTCLVDKLKSARMSGLVQAADVVVPQAYSTKGASASHRVGGAYGPGGLQVKAANGVASALALSGGTIIMGLAAYGRAGWPGKSAREIMTIELAKTVELASAHDIRGARYWSWKWIAGFNGQLGDPAMSYADPFLRDIALPPP